VEQDDYEPRYGAQDYDAEIGHIQQQLQEAAGSDDEYRNRALQAQMKSAQEARANAMKIAQLQASTSRYGIDAQSATAMRALKENARQFDAQHGLDIAKAYTAFASTPDLMFARNDFMSAMGRVGQGLTPQPAITQSPGPQAKTWQDFSALAQYNGSQVPGAESGGGGGGAAQPSAAPGGSGLAANGTEQAKPPPDPRLQAAGAIMKALPPSETPGADGQDWNAINAIVEMYKSGKPGVEARLGPARTKIAMAGLARQGYDPALISEEYNRSLPGQLSPMLA
jgi:hypothetical protein